MGEHETVKIKQISVNSSVLVELIKHVEVMESLVETLEINLDADILKQVEESKKDFAQGRVKNIKTKTELSAYLNSL
ncbi:TPA: hypothetical protein HA238_05265 [Candidatus Micrarchaeota archaeon]|nr:hypothetical protein [Candidatus Micrarchaeota archaeon]